MNYADRLEVLQRRVNEAAQALSERGIRPTVTRLRAALGGGSPNDLAPALKAWRASSPPAAGNDVKVSIPPPIADLAHELWQRATAAALLELKGGGAAIQVAVRTEEAHQLRHEIAELREHLQSESLAWGELQIKLARQEAIARDAQSRLDESATRERSCLRELGAARERIVELTATIQQLRSSHPSGPVRAPARPKPTSARKKRSKPRAPAKPAVAPTKKKSTSPAATRRRRRLPRRTRRPRR